MECLRTLGSAFPMREGTSLVRSLPGRWKLFLTNQYFIDSLMSFGLSAGMRISVRNPLPFSSRDLLRGIRAPIEPFKEKEIACLTKLPKPDLATMPRPVLPTLLSSLRSSFWWLHPTIKAPTYDFTAGNRSSWELPV